MVHRGMIVTELILLELRFVRALDVCHLRGEDKIDLLNQISRYRTMKGKGLLRGNLKARRFNLERLFQYDVRHDVAGQLTRYKKILSENVTTNYICLQATQQPKFPSKMTMRTLWILQG